MTDSAPTHGEFRVFGPPGTGKTTYCARQATRAAEKYGSDAVIVASFTRAAAQEIGSRDLPLDHDRTGTLHAHCLRALGRPNIAEGFIDSAPANSDVTPWNDAYPQYRLSSARTDEDVANVQRATRGDDLMQRVQIHRGRMDPVETWAPDERGFFHDWQDWCDQHYLTDFTGLIERCLVETDVAPGAPAVGVFDEVQDFTPLQLALVRRWIRHMDFAIMAGDDDQTLYSWIGCRPDAFLNPPLPGEQKRLLSRSYRVPRAIHALATDWIGHVAVREPKDYEPRDVEGEVTESAASWKAPDILVPDMEERLAAGQSVMLLASCSYMLRPTVMVLRANGIPFHNPFRTTNGAWNPMGARKGTTASDRLLAFLRPETSVWGESARFWTVPDLRAWVKPLRAQGVLARGAKKRLEDMGDDDPVTFDLLVDLFHEQHLNPIFEGDLRWYENHLIEQQAKTMTFPMRVFEKHGAAGLLQPPKVTVGTIHSVKGGEADHVYLWPDLSIEGFWNGWMANPDPTRRQFYVGMTRARESLTLCGAAGNTAVNWKSEVARAA